MSGKVDPYCNPCERCGAEIGEPCRNLRTGEALDLPHIERTRPAER